MERCAFNKSMDRSPSTTAGKAEYIQPHGEKLINKMVGVYRSLPIAYFLNKTGSKIIR